MSLLTILDIKSKCRVCLCVKLDMKSLHDSQQNPTIAQMLSKLTVQEIPRLDDFPDLICSECFNLVVSAYKLIEQFERSNKILKEWLENNQTTSNWNYNEQKNSELEKSLNTEELLTSFSKDNNAFKQNKSAADNENDKEVNVDLFVNSNIYKLCTEENLSENELLNLLEDDKTQHMSDNEDELPFWALVESSDASQMEVDPRIFEEPQNLLKTIEILENKLLKSGNSSENYELKSKYNNNKLAKNRESKEFLNCNKSSTKEKNKDKLFSCPKCEKNFTTKDYLRRHIENHDKKCFVCRECCEEFATKEELITHGKTQGHDKPLLCPECGQRCKSSDILTVHLRRHRGEKPFKCKFCGKGFPRRGDLKIHEKYHTGDKSHFCDICGKGFFRKYSLRIHLRVHTGEKPYNCPHCPQGFAQSNDLKSHIRRHTGERFRCEVCSAAFLQAYQIRQHKLQVHGIHELPPTQRVQKFILH